MSKIVSLLEYINKNIKIEPCCINIYICLYEVEEVLNISNITMEARLNNITNNQEELINLRIEFKNVKSFFLQDVSGIIRISGFEIIDHKEDGWSPENRFEIHDFENGDIHFTCQEFLFNGRK